MTTQIALILHSGIGIGSITFVTLEGVYVNGTSTFSSFARCQKRLKLLNVR